MADQGVEYATFIGTELTHEYDRRDTVNSRSATAITSATGLVTLTLAVLAVAKGKDFTLHGSALIALVVGLIALLLSGFFALLAGMNWKYEVTSDSTLQLMLKDHWTDSEVTARNTAAYCNVLTIKSLRRGNNIKHTLLLCAGYAQVAAIVALSVSVLVAVT